MYNKITADIERYPATMQRPNAFAVRDAFYILGHRSLRVR